MQQLAQKLKQAREQCGFSQEALAQAIGVGKTTISAYETGQNIPPLPKLMAIAQALGLEVEVFVRTGEALPKAAAAPTPLLGRVRSIDQTLESIVQTVPYLLRKHANLLQAQQLERDIRRARHELSKMDLERQC